jgi:hypothetical protein
MTNRLSGPSLWLALAGVLVLSGCGPKSHTLPTPPLSQKTLDPLEAELQKSYLTLFQTASSLDFTPDQIEKTRKYLEDTKGYCVGEFKQKADQLDAKISAAEKNLKENQASIPEAERHELHCEIQNDRLLKAQAKVAADHGIPIAYQNKEAKLDLIEKWPADLKQIKQEIADGSYRNRQWGDVQDIGFRVIAKGQEDDIKTGEDAVKQMKESGLMPPVINNPAINEYVKGVAEKVARHSDLKVPLHVTLLNSKEVNAFALPGGFLFIERGLLDEADDESELAGVIGHEISHDVARHGHKLMTRAEVAQILLQAAEVAATVLTGGAAGIGTYYALQYGFYGLSLVMNLELLGISREYELQADKLGIQYTWNAGYDPTGFIRFFDKMASKQGYVQGLGWFYDHPPFYERMVDAEKEIMFLPKKTDLIVNTDAFGTMKKQLASVREKAKKEEKKAPSLVAHEEGCPKPPELDTAFNQSIESLCAVPATQKASSEGKGSEKQ